MPRCRCREFIRSLLLLNFQISAWLHARNTRASARVLTRHAARASVLAAAARRTAHMRKTRSEVVRAEDAEDVARREAQAANIGRLFLLLLPNPYCLFERMCRMRA